MFRPTACKWLQQHDRIKKALRHDGPQWKVISQLYFWGTRSKHRLKDEYNSAAFKKSDADAEVEVAAGSEEGEVTKNSGDGTSVLAEERMAAVNDPDVDTSEKSSPKAGLADDRHASAEGETGSSIEEKRVSKNEDMGASPPAGEEEAASNDREGGTLKLRSLVATSPEQEAEAAHCDTDGVHSKKEGTKTSPGGMEDHEDIIIRTVVERSKFVSWDALASNLPGWAPAQVRERWFQHLVWKAPGWATLTSGGSGSRNEGNEVPTLPEEKAGGQESDKGKSECPLWLCPQDQIINAVVQYAPEQPFTKWKYLALLLPGWPAKKIRERWANRLHPVLKQGPFRKEEVRLSAGEDRVGIRSSFSSLISFVRPPSCKRSLQHRLLKAAHEDLGPQWKAISETYFKGTRAENTLKNTYNTVSFKKNLEAILTEERHTDAVAEAGSGGKDEAVSKNEGRSSSGTAGESTASGNNRDGDASKNRSLEADLVQEGHSDAKTEADGVVKEGRMSENDDGDKSTNRSGLVSTSAEEVEASSSDKDGEKSNEDDAVRLPSAARPLTKTATKMTGEFSAHEDILIRTVVECSEEMEERPFTAWDALELILPGRTSRQMRARWAQPPDERRRAKKRKSREQMLPTGARMRTTQSQVNLPPTPQPTMMYPGFPPTYQTANPQYMHPHVANPATMPPAMYAPMHSPFDGGGVSWIPGNAPFHPQLPAKYSREDAIIKSFMQNDPSFRDWDYIAHHLPGWIGENVRHRWVNHLNPFLTKGTFSREEVRQSFDETYSASDRYFAA